MKHLIETEDLSSLATAPYDRIILDSTKNEIVYRGGGGNPNGYPYVDLGLPSGLKWATMNIGATSETEVGDYFMWGSTTPNTNTSCNWTKAPFNNGLTNYNSYYFNSVKDTVCPNGILAKEYDAAAQIMSGDWRMPTRAEVQELINNTNSERAENFKGSGVNGYKFTSKKDTSKYIFIPFSGYRSGSSFSERSTLGSAWSSSLSTSDLSYAWDLEIDTESSPAVDLSQIYRWFGQPVRGVFK